MAAGTSPWPASRAALPGQHQTGWIGRRSRRIAGATVPAAAAAGRWADGSPRSLSLLLSSLQLVDQQAHHRQGPRLGADQHRCVCPPGSEAARQPGAGSWRLAEAPTRDGGRLQSAAASLTDSNQPACSLFVQATWTSPASTPAPSPPLPCAASCASRARPTAPWTTCGPPSAPTSASDAAAAVMQRQARGLSLGLQRRARGGAAGRGAPRTSDPSSAPL